MNRRAHLAYWMITVAVVGGSGFVHRPVAGQVVAAPAVSRSLLNLGLAAVGQSGSIRYGGVGNTSVSSSWRALPSEARFNQQASGMMQSEQRYAVMASGGGFFGGSAAQLTQPTPGTLRYTNPYARSTMSAWRPPTGAITPTWTRPSSPLMSSTRPLGTTSLTQPFAGGGSIRYGGAAMSSPLSRPMAAGSSRPSSPGGLSPLTRPLGQSTTTRSFGGGGYGTIRYGGY